MSLALSPRWERFHSVVGDLLPATEYVEWSVKVRPGGWGDRRILWVCRDRETGRVLNRLGQTLLKDHPEVLSRLAPHALQAGVGWDGDHDALKVYATLETDSVGFDEIARLIPRISRTPPVAPTVTVGFVQTPEWKARHYLFWRREWFSAAQVCWMTSVIGSGWTAALVTQDRGGIVIRETGDIDVAVGFPPGGLDASPRCALAPALHDIARRERRLSGRMRNLSWVTAPLAKNPHPRELVHFNLYVRSRLEN
jgi:hypothetical protein